MKFLFGKIGVCIVAAVLLAGCELLNGKKEKPEPPAIPGKIVFSMADDSEMENYQIYLMNTDGSDIEQLTHFESDEAFQPSWSPDGEQIVFSTSLRSSSAGASLYVMNADGSNIRPLKERPYTHVVTPGYHPKWSPDGSKIAFDFCDNCNAGGKNYEVFVYDFETDTVTQITENLARDTYPSWSPDGQQLAFTSNREYVDAEENRFRQDIYIYDMDGTNLQRITETGNATIPNWHPVDSLIAYEWNVRRNQVYLYKFSSQKTIELDTNMEFEGAPQWSINGKYMMLYGRENEEAAPEIQYYKKEQDQFSFIKSINNNQYLSDGRDFYWHYSETN